jgi:hypothetical protein
MECRRPSRNGTGARTRRKLTASCWLPWRFHLYVVSAFRRTFRRLRSRNVEFEHGFGIRARIPNS